MIYLLIMSIFTLDGKYVEKSTMGAYETVEQCELGQKIFRGKYVVVKDVVYENRFSCEQRKK